MSDNLPPLPDWLQLTNDEVRSRVRAYGQQCRQQALEDAAELCDAWRSLYRRAVNEANGLTNYVEERPELRRAERNLSAIEAEARALKDKP